MANIDTLNSQLAAVGDAIRAKLETQDTYKISEMPDAIASISGGGVTQPLVMTEIKPYTPSSGIDGFSSVTPQLDLVVDVGKVRTLGYTGNTYNGNQPIFGSSGITKKLHTIFGDNLNIINSVTILIDSTNIGDYGLDLNYIATREEDQAFFRDKVKFVFRGSATPDVLDAGSGCFISYNPYIETLTENNFDWSDFTFINDIGDSIFQPIFSDMYKLTTIDTSVKNFYFEYFNKAKLGTIMSGNNMFFNKSYNFRDEIFYNALLKKIVDSIRHTNVYTFCSTSQFPGISTMTIPKKLMPNTSQNCSFSSGWWIAGGGSRLSHIVFESYTSEDEESDLYRFAKIQIKIDCGYTDGTGASLLDSSKRIINASSYASLKNDPDAWTSDKSYSFYNHTSAVETINSLPDMTKNKNTATGLTYTMQFKGGLGSATDGGAINTLTAEEIAVATAKGWTITLV